MYDENAQDEASITVIATGLDEHNATSSVSKAMTGFSSNNFKTQVPDKAASAEAAATEAAPDFTKPAQPAFNRTFNSGAAAQPTYTCLLYTSLAIIIAFAVSALLCPVIIPFLHKLKFGQQVRDDGPQSHLKKQGTPTMGGLIILSSIIITSVFYIPSYPRIIPGLFMTCLLYTAICV